MIHTLILLALVFAGCQTPEASPQGVPLPDSLMTQYKSPLVSNSVAIPEDSKWTDQMIDRGIERLEAFVVNRQ